MGRYVYRPLAGNEIRCIVLEPGKSLGETHSYSLVQRSIEGLSFTALSYVWGDPSETDTILLDGTPIEVTRNLAACLKQLEAMNAHDPVDSVGLRQEPMLLWVDAICINQEDLSEKSAQVLRMGEIYSTAEETIVWLGGEGEHTTAAIRWMRDIAQRVRGFGDHLRRWRDPDFQAAMRKVYEEIFHGGDTSAHKGLSDLYHRPWWARVWVVQEFALAKKVNLVCGDAVLSYEDLYLNHLPLYLFMIVDAEAFQRDNKTIEDFGLVRPMSTVNLRALLVDSFGDDKDETTLQKLLDTFNARHATNPRDRVYAFFGIKSDFTSEEIAPDYSQSTKSVYIGVIRAHFNKYETLSILNQCRPSLNKDQAYPSWVPRWDQPLSADDEVQLLPWQPYKGDNDERLIPYRASKDLPLSNHPWHIDEEQGNLHLTGATIDTIAMLTNPADLKDPENTMKVAEAWMKFAEQQGSTYSLTNESMRKACRRVLVADFYIPGKGRKQRGSLILLPEDGSIENQGTTWSYKDTLKSFTDIAGGRRMAITNKGWLGLVPQETEVGDYVTVLVGGPTLYVLREPCRDDPRGKPEDQRAYNLVGEAFVHGMMDGEAIGIEPLREIILC